MQALQLTYISKECIGQYLPNNPIIIEAGAHKGRDTIEMAQRWPLGHIHTFEPIPELFEQLVEKTKQYPNITCYNYALSDHSGSAPLYRGQKRLSAASSLLHPLHYSEQFDPILVNLITLDEWAIKHHITHVDCMWLDLQGAELAALTGATTILKTVRAIHSEANLVERYKGSPLYPELKSWLEHREFTLIAESFYKETWGNILAIKNNLQ
jgi:FkbM family methyltransferase